MNPPHRLQARTPRLHPAQAGLSRVSLVVIVAMVLAGTAGSLAWVRSQAAVPVVAAQATPVMELLAQDIATVSLAPLDRTLALTGTLRALNRSELKSPLAGQVAAVMAREGDTVRRGQALVTLDTADLQARLRDRDGAVQAGQAQLALARKTYDNNQALLRQNFISQAAFDNATSGLDAAQATVQSLQAQRDQARKALADSVVRASIDGVVAQRVAEPGLSVPVNATLMAVHDLSVMELEALVPTGQIPLVRVGQPVAFSVEGFGDRRFEGQVDRIAPSAAAGARSIAVFVRVANTGNQLRGGMFAEGTLVLGRDAQALLLPQAAVRKLQGANQVLRIDGDTLTLATLELGAVDTTSGRVQVLSGAKAGDRVVVGATRLQAGQPVRIVTPQALAPAGAASAAAH